MELVVPIGDPGNLGALIRSAEAFGVTRAVLTSEAAHPFLPKAVKASAGSVLRLPMARGPALHQFPDTCIALDMGGTDIDKFIWPKNAMLAVGEEGKGLGKAHFKKRVHIATAGVESLNAVVAASIALALWKRAF
jgi:TrmH family RNA methyltransferase